MAQFFIDRPVFAWVIALFILVMGGVAITQLPISQYPSVAPPSIVVTTIYPGASAQTLEDSVISVIEREMNGSPGLIYMESVSQANGTGTITLSFEPGTNPDLAQVDVQNRLSRATPRLPAVVNQQGVRVEKTRSNFLLFTILSSDNPQYDPIALGDYASRNVLPEIQRIPGVGQAQLFGTERAMRVWIDPAKLQGFNLSAADVVAAIRAQNAQVSSGTIGELPNVAGQGVSATVVVKGQFTSAEEFGNIVLRANTDGSSVRLARCRAHRTGRPGLCDLGAPERQAVHRHRRAAHAHGQRAGHRGGRAQAHGRAVEAVPAGREVRNSLRQFALRQDLHHRGRHDPAGGGGAGVPGDVPVPAELPLHHHPDHRGAGGAAGHLRRAAGAGLLDQRADHVRHGAGDRHRGGRCHRGGRERRAHHERGRPAAACRRRARRCGRSRAPSSA